MINQCRIAEIVDVTECAIGAEPSKQADRGALVATLAFDRCVSPNQGKPVFVPIHIFYDLTPSADAMALFTVAAKLTPMDVGMAISTLASYFRKNLADMAFRAIEASMHSFQGVTRGAVIEIGEWTDRLPA